MLFYFRTRFLLILKQTASTITLVQTERLRYPVSCAITNISCFFIMSYGTVYKFFSDFQRLKKREYLRCTLSHLHKTDHCHTNMIHRPLHYCWRCRTYRWLSITFSFNNCRYLFKLFIVQFIMPFFLMYLYMNIYKNAWYRSWNSHGWWWSTHGWTLLLLKTNSPI